MASEIAFDPGLALSSKWTISRIFVSHPSNGDLTHISLTACLSSGSAQVALLPVCHSYIWRGWQVCFPSSQALSSITESGQDGHMSRKLQTRCPACPAAPTGHPGPFSLRMRVGGTLRLTDSVAVTHQRSCGQSGLGQAQASHPWSSEPVHVPCATNPHKGSRSIFVAL